MKKQENMNALLLDGIKDIYDAEKQATKAMPKLVKAASSQPLKDALNQHLDITKKQIERLEQVFERMGEKPRAKTCKAMQGLVEEAQEHLEEHEGSPLLDPVIVASAQKMEHYEISSYGTMRAYADALGNKQVAQMLQQTLDEEQKADQMLSELGERINQACVAMPQGSR
jgi:ferritin-like metal-binding protein YciE